MGGSRNSDEVACWPCADLGFMDAAVGVNVLYGVREEEDPEHHRQLLAELTRDTSVWASAELYEAQELIDPRDTRAYLAAMLDTWFARRSSSP